MGLDRGGVLGGVARSFVSLADAGALGLAIA
jgi:hypothetical protein